MAIETYELRVFGIASVQTQESVLHFIGSGLTANDTFRNGQNLVNGFFANVLSAWLDCCGQNYNVLKLTARRVGGGNSAEAFASFGLGLEVGTISADPSGNQTRPSMFLVPVMGTKSGGRVFLPSAPQSTIVDNSYSPAYLAATAALGAILIGGFTSSGITWTSVVYSRKLGTSSAVVATQMSPFIGFQRRSKKVS